MKKIIAIMLVLLISATPCVYASEAGYIVRLQPGVTPPEYINAESLFPETNVWLFQNSSDVASMGSAVISGSPNQEISLHSNEMTVEDTFARFQWHFKAVHADFAHRWDVRGQGVTVAILDCGINRNSSDFDPTLILPGRSFIDGHPETDTSDGVGHGTFVAGLIAAQGGNGRLGKGIANRAKIMPIRVASGGMLTTAWLVAGLNYALENGADVVNMSLGTSAELPEVAACIDKMTEKGIIVVAATSDGGTTLPDYPSFYPNVVSVGGVTPDKERPLYSSYNSSLTCVAPSTSLFSLSYQRDDGMRYGGSGGTSYAAPIVTAAAALAKSINPDLDCNGFMDLLADTCEDLGLPGYDIEYGYGLLNIESMLKKQFETLPSSVSVYDSYEVDGQNVYKVRNVGEPVQATLQYTANNDELNETQTTELSTGLHTFSFPKGENPKFEIRSTSDDVLAAR